MNSEHVYKYVEHWRHCKILYNFTGTPTGTHYYFMIWHSVCNSHVIVAFESVKAYDCVHIVDLIAIYRFSDYYT